MSQMPYPPAAPPPSWLVPITFGAAVTFLVTGLLGVLSAIPDFAVSATVCCCCGLSFVPYGFVPAFVAQRRDPAITAGQGFAVSFIAVGVGMIMWAGVTALTADPVDPAMIREQFEAMRDELPEDSRWSDEELDDYVARWTEITPYLPVLIAGLVTVLSAFVGMLTISMFRSRRPPPQTYGGVPTDH